MASPGRQLRKPASADVLFKAFSDRTRLRLLNLLRTGETCVCDLVRVLAAPQAKVSRHLAYLRKAGLVRARKQGLWHHYRLAEPTSDFHRKLLECLDCCLGDVPELRRDLMSFDRRGGCCAPSTDSATPPRRDPRSRAVEPLPSSDDPKTSSSCQCAPPRDKP
jgi:ArsR family transcriptional regulator, arsenate/arsenite/antimonite-responsive transcriptional repressor